MPRAGPSRMPSKRPSASRARTAPKRPSTSRPATPKKAAARPVPKPKAKSAPAITAVTTPSTKLPELGVTLPGGRRHVLSLSFVRDGDEFLARLESDSGHITEIKNRSLDQLLSLVANELEDLLE